MADDTHPLSDEVLRDLAQHFREHATHIYGYAAPRNASPLYAHLCGEAADDPDVLALVSEADRNTQITNLLFGAVHYLLLSGIAHPLTDFYPDLVAAPRPSAEAYPSFREFCLEHAEDIQQLVTTRRVQTNEVGRCAGLAVAFGLIARRTSGRPLALVEIGASAGLHLLWDRYHYDFGSAGHLGDGPVRISCEPRGAWLPPVPKAMPQVAFRVGVDLHPIDARDEDTVRWLRALIWPEHADRVRRFNAALGLAREYPPHIVAGNAPDVLIDVLAGVPEDSILCLYHSYTLNQMPPAVRAETLDRITAISKHRKLVRVAQEWYAEQEQPHLELYSYEGGGAQREHLACCESHGRWIEWLRADLSDSSSTGT